MGNSLQTVTVVPVGSGDGSVSCNAYFRVFPNAAQGTPEFNITDSAVASIDSKDWIIAQYSYYGGGTAPTRDQLIDATQYATAHAGQTGIMDFNVARCHGTCCCCAFYTYDNSFVNAYVNVNAVYFQKYGSYYTSANSGYRCPIHNRQVGSTSTNHPSGNAFDYNGASTGIWRFSLAGNEAGIARTRILLYPTGAAGPYKSLEQLILDGAEERNGTTYLGSDWDEIYTDYVHGHMTTN